MLTRLHLEELGAIVEDFKREGIESVAVCLLHAYAASGHEQARLPDVDADQLRSGRRRHEVILPGAEAGIIRRDHG